MKTLFQIHKFLITCLFACFVAFISCESESGMDETDSEQKDDNQSSNNFSSDELSDFLVLNDAVEITADLPAAPDQHLKVNVKDTIYLAKDFPGGSRIVIWHNGLYDITGCHVAVDGGAYYYDVPVTEAEAGDSTDIIYIDVKVPEDVIVDYPLTIPIKIQPYDADGEPLDEFDKVVILEDPNDNETCLPTSIYYCEEIDSQSLCNSPWKWIWEFTVVEDGSGDIRTVYAPALFINIKPFQHGGCCWNGFSTPAKYDPYCVPANPEYSELTVDNEYYVRFFESMDLFDNGTYNRNSYNARQTYYPDSSNYCTGEAGYLFFENFFFAWGKHNFSSQSANIHFTDTKIYGGNSPIVWYGLKGDLTYTCHSLMISYPVNGEMWTEVFRKHSEIEWEEFEDFFYRNWD